MIIQEQLGNNRIKTSSNDETKELLQIETGIIYGEAIDVLPLKYSYQEVDKKELDVVTPEI